MRDLFFIGLVGGGLFAVGVNLMPPRLAKAPILDQPIESGESDIQGTVERVNGAFRQQWSSASVRPAAPATDLQISRRLALGLMGTLPSLEEIRQLESLAPEQRIPWWLDHVFKDRRFADYFAERFARAYVGAENGPFLFFRRRRFVAWLADEFAQNRPYNKVVQQLIAEEGLWTDKPATNFVTVTTQQDKENQPDPVRLAGRVTRAFLGLRLDCAQCHDHPFASWVKADFEGLSAFFGQTHLGFKGINDGQGEYELKDRKTEQNKVIAANVPFAQDLLPENGTRRQRLAQWVTHPKNPYFARATVNRVWALMFGRALVEPVDNLQVEGTVPPALQLLADDFVAHDYDLRRLMRLIASTEVFRVESAVADGDIDPAEKTWASFPLTRLRPEQMAGSIVQASSVGTINAETHLLGRLIRFGEKNEFVTRYGDDGEDEFDGKGGTIPQRLLMMNGKLVRENVGGGPNSASKRIAWLAPNDPSAVESAYLAALTRRPTPEEAAHFEAALAKNHDQRGERIQDLFWALINSTEFSWNH
jgi:Protein of unknown function (DUF1553)/Protein of unknown function (DUF1549)